MLCARVSHFSESELLHSRDTQCVTHKTQLLRYLLRNSVARNAFCGYGLWGWWLAAVFGVAKWVFENCEKPSCDTFLPNVRATPFPVFVMEFIVRRTWFSNSLRLPPPLPLSLLSLSQDSFNMSSIRKLWLWYEICLNESPSQARTHAVAWTTPCDHLPPPPLPLSARK